MSTTTPYLGLTLYDASGDQSVTFATFRAVWGGTATTSNFYKIDTSASSFNSRITSLETNRGSTPVPALFISANFYQATGISAITAYNTGMTIVLSVDTTSNGTVTLDINSLGTKSVMKVDSTGTAINLTGSDLVKGRQYLFIYDGTRWLWVSANSADQIQIVGTSGNVVTVGSTNNLLGTTTQAGLIADTTHAATAKTTPADSDEFPLIDSAASYVLKKITFVVLKLAIIVGIKPAEGVMWNGKISPTVTSNNITLALKTLAGSDASSTDPIYITIGGVVRTITAALSVTKTGGSGGYFGAASTELATLEIDYFAYLGYNATDGVVIGFARFPYANLYSDFSTTASNEKYCAISTITNASSSDSYRNIGRFAATLSATSNWSVPTYTASNLIQRPIYQGRWLTWNPQLSAGVMTVGSISIDEAVYRFDMYDIKMFLRETFTTSGTASSTATATLPFSVADGASFPLLGSSAVNDGGGNLAGIAVGSSSGVTVQKYDASNFGLGSGRIIRCGGNYRTI